MPTISPEISIKITGLLKSMGKVSEQSISEAKKKYMKEMVKLHLVF